MTKKEIAIKIAENMLDNGMSDECNYNYDTGVLLEDVKNIILEHLENYIIVIGTILD